MVAVTSFYLDDSGTRHPDHKPDLPQHKHDWFALGGILINDEDIPAAEQLIDAFRLRWPDLNDSPLHSWEIRGRHGAFKWLGKTPGTFDAFVTSLETLLFELPVTGLACVIDRPGYNNRYREQYGRQRWSLCKTAFAVAVERATKRAISQHRKLRVFVERTSKADDRKLQEYYDVLKQSGHWFNAETAEKYSPASPVDYKNTLYEFRTKKKTSRLMQIADIYLWPMCIDGYDKGNRAYTRLLGAGKLIDCSLSTEDIPVLGIKYSCFDA